MGVLAPRAEDFLLISQRVSRDTRTQMHTLIQWIFPRLFFFFFLVWYSQIFWFMCPRSIAAVVPFQWQTEYKLKIYIVFSFRSWFVKRGISWSRRRRRKKTNRRSQCARVICGTGLWFFTFFSPSLNKHLRSWRVSAGARRQSRCPMSCPSSAITGRVSSHSVHTNKLHRLWHSK